MSQKPITVPPSTLWSLPRTEGGPELADSHKSKQSSSSSLAGDRGIRAPIHSSPCPGPFFPSFSRARLTQTLPKTSHTLAEASWSPGPEPLIRLLEPPLLHSRYHSLAFPRGHASGGSIHGTNKKPRADESSPGRSASGRQSSAFRS